MPIGLWLLSLLSLILETAVAVAIIRSREFRRFPLVLALAAYGILVIVISLVVLKSSGLSGETYSLVYSASDVINHGLIIALIISLAADALSGSPRRALAISLLTLSVLAFAFASLAVYYSAGRVHWTPVSRNMSFCEEILNFILWMVLISSRRRDKLLLLVTAGIGLQVTGEVIGNSIRVHSQFDVIQALADVLVVGSEMLCLVIWFYAFWKVAPAHAANRNAG